MDYIKTERLCNLAQEIFGDILHVYKQGNWWWSLGMTSTLVQLRGLETIMYDMYDYPDELHRLMAFLRDALRAGAALPERNCWAKAGRKNEISAKSSRKGAFLRA